MMNGKIIDGRYEIIEEIGRGGMAIVYLAKCMVLNRYVGIKVLRPEYRDDAEFIKRFKIEAQSAGSLSHPNIVSIYDVGNEDDIEYIVMEYVEGITLKQYLSTKGVLPWKEAVDFASQISSGLEHAHKKGIVHKDIKPENIIITKEGILKITDFGIAKALNQGTIATGGLTMGSVHYFSPEQARGGFTDAKTDLYSLGILLYEMVTGKLPFEGDSAISVAMQHLEKPPVRPSIYNPSIPRGLEAVILKAMKKEQSERYQSATQMLIDLKKVYVGTEVRYEDDAGYTKKFTPVTPSNGKRPNGANGGRPGANGGRPGANGSRPGSNGTRPGANGGKPIPGNPRPNPNAPKRKPTEEELKQMKKKNKKGDALGIVAGIMAAIAVLAVIFVVGSFMMGGSKNEVECPELVNLTCEEALALVDGTKLKIVVEGGGQITAEDEGIIVTQNPKSGRKIKNNAKITVTLGDEPAETEKVPSVSGMSESDATNALRARGFDVRIEQQDNGSVAAGRVIGTSPSSGTAISQGATVTVYVSTGNADNDDEYTIVPNLIGKTESEAKQILERANLELGEVQQISSSKEKGTIVRQSEAEGNRVKKNKAVDIRISSGTSSSAATPTPSDDDSETSKPSASAKPTSTSKPSATPTPESSDSGNGSESEGDGSESEE